MKTLGFARLGCVVDGRRVRPSVFQSRSTLPVSAACLVANAARQILSDLLGAAVSLKLLEPLMPDAAAWSSIGKDALVFAMRGTQSDAAIVLRAHDALALACAALGESVESGRGLSLIEAELTARIASALCGALAAVCGPNDVRKIERIKTLEGYATYFELIVEEPSPVRIGIALSREPQSQVAPGLRTTDLHEVDLRLGAEIAHGFVPAAALVSLRPGHVFKLDSALGDTAQLRAGGAIVARGQCGNLGARRAFAMR
ncbi:MAG TPA: FliM/FliN family flagellar motor C-terminal domain-containing protein [Candidatus Rubrimentiphilum sp.]|nr:FliM/FliN family flagellar motor C-terminal domain-containing protein [Candidatus Rubrimentiphilum sp.]